MASTRRSTKGFVIVDYYEIEVSRGVWFLVDGKVPTVLCRTMKDVNKMLALFQALNSAQPYGDIKTSVTSKTLPSNQVEELLNINLMIPIVANLWFRASHLFESDTEVRKAKRFEFRFQHPNPEAWMREGYQSVFFFFDSTENGVDLLGTHLWLKFLNYGSLYYQMETDEVELTFSQWAVEMFTRPDRIAYLKNMIDPIVNPEPSMLTSSERLIVIDGILRQRKLMNLRLHQHAGGVASSIEAQGELALATMQLPESTEEEKANKGFALLSIPAVRKELKEVETHEAELVRVNQLASRGLAITARVRAFNDASPTEELAIQNEVMQWTTDVRGVPQLVELKATLLGAIHQAKEEIEAEKDRMIEMSRIRTRSVDFDESQRECIPTPESIVVETPAPPLKTLIALPVVSKSAVSSPGPSAFRSPHSVKSTHALEPESDDDSLRVKTGLFRGMCDAESTDDDDESKGTEDIAEPELSVTPPTPIVGERSVGHPEESRASSHTTSSGTEGTESTSPGSLREFVVSPSVRIKKEQWTEDEGCERCGRITPNHHDDSCINYRRRMKVNAAWMQALAGHPVVIDLTGSDDEDVVVVGGKRPRE